MGGDAVREFRRRLDPRPVIRLAGGRSRSTYTGSLLPIPCRLGAALSLLLARVAAFFPRDVDDVNWAVWLSVALALWLISSALVGLAAGKVLGQATSQA